MIDAEIYVKSRAKFVCAGETQRDSTKLAWRRNETRRDGAA